MKEASEEHVRISRATVLSSYSHVSHELEDYARKSLACKGKEDCTRTGLL